MSDFSPLAHRKNLAAKVAEAASRVHVRMLDAGIDRLHVDGVGLLRAHTVSNPGETFFSVLCWDAHDEGEDRPFSEVGGDLTHPEPTDRNGFVYRVFGDPCRLLERSSTEDHLRFANNYRQIIAALEHEERRVSSLCTKAAIFLDCHQDSRKPPN